MFRAGRTCYKGHHTPIGSTLSTQSSVLRELRAGAPPARCRPSDLHRCQVVGPCQRRALVAFAYRQENEAALRQDWPRVPIPADAKLLEASAKLGRTVADLLLPDKPVAGVTTGKLRPELRALAVPKKISGKSIEEPADTKVEAG